VQFAVGGMLLHQLLAAILDTALASFAGSGRTQEFPVSSDLDPAMQEEVQWHAVSGVRISRTREFFSDKVMLTKLLILGLLVEPLQYLTSVLLSGSQDVLDTSNPPLLFDMLLPSASPVVAVLQQLSTMLAGKSSRLTLLFRFAGCSCMEDWGAQEPDLYKLFCSCILTASAWVWRRHHRELHSYPWKLFQVADQRSILRGFPDMHGPLQPLHCRCLRGASVGAPFIT
jgi:hypothetical protein